MLSDKAVIESMPESDYAAGEVPVKILPLVVEFSSMPRTRLRMVAILIALYVCPEHDSFG